MPKNFHAVRFRQVQPEPVHPLGSGRGMRGGQFADPGEAKPVPRHQETGECGARRQDRIENRVAHPAMQDRPVRAVLAGEELGLHLDQLIMVARQLELVALDRQRLGRRAAAKRADAGRFQDRAEGCDGGVTLRLDAVARRKGSLTGRIDQDAVPAIAQVKTVFGGLGDRPPDAHQGTGAVDVGQKIPDCPLGRQGAGCLGIKGGDLIKRGDI